jgi:hypothetical protein
MAAGKEEISGETVQVISGSDPLIIVLDVIILMP